MEMSLLIIKHVLYLHVILVFIILAFNNRRISYIDIIFSYTT